MTNATIHAFGDWAVALCGWDGAGYRWADDGETVTCPDCLRKLSEKKLDFTTRPAASVPLVVELVVALSAVTERLSAMLTLEKRPTLAAWPKSGVEYVGVDAADCPEVKQARAVLAKAKGAGGHEAMWDAAAQASARKK